MFKYFFEKNVKNVIDCENPVSKFLQKPLFCTQRHGFLQNWKILEFERDRV